MAEGDTPKIVVDSDWKSQARAEKERLAAAERQKAAEKQKRAEASPAAPPAGAPGKGPARSAETDDDRGLPPADFQSLIGTLITQALMYLGAFPDPQTGRAVVSLEHGRFHIDLLSVLEEKTKGNLTQAESQDLKQALYELQMRYVEISKAVAQMAQKGKVAGPGAGAGPIGIPAV
jgi:hypothetical protein